MTRLQRSHQGSVERHVVGTVQPRGTNRRVAACLNEDSLWVEIAGPKGGGAWQLSTVAAHDLAEKLLIAADLATSLAVPASNQKEQR